MEPDENHVDSYEELVSNSDGEGEEEKEETIE